ncbi:hypothetical protein H6G81_05840 [Scytonema hofmannii FACHB-248]|uniref:Uncharacterized protein n=1 Tax=Scytonema hofmannii FACHB-248 TaxID=1842502 RepID=A0ABR8GLN1_9CYAN|nr:MULTISPECIES: hypothetical protein [Nostocales]MBD2604058.1 hypothetical protein [Scytonema hofmannii FACHB-248]
MELAQFILTAILYILIYGFSTLFIFQFILEISVAFEKDCRRNTFIKHTVSKSEILTEKSQIRISNNNKNQLSTTKPITVQQLRKKCSQAGIKWSYAIQESKTDKKRHLNREEMLIALTQIKQSA